MTWTTPKTWVTNEPLTASDLNTHLRDNLNELKSPPSDEFTLDQAFNYTTSATNFVDVDSTNLALTITTNGGDVEIGFDGTFSVNANLLMYFNVSVDGIQITNNDGLGAQTMGTTTYYLVGFNRILTGLSAGSHTFKLMWKVSGNTATLYAGAGTSGADLHPQFWIREV